MHGEGRRADRQGDTQQPRPGDAGQGEDDGRQDDEGDLEEDRNAHEEGDDRHGDGDPVLAEHSDEPTGQRVGAVGPLDE